MKTSKCSICNSPRLKWHWSFISHFINMLTISVAFEQSLSEQPHDRSFSPISQVFLSVFTLKPSGIRDVTRVLTCVNHELSMMITFV